MFITHQGLRIAASAAAALALAGCCAHDEPPPKSTRVTPVSGTKTVAPEPAPAPVQAAATAEPAGYKTMMFAYPSGDPATSMVTLEKIIPAEVSVGQPFDYTLKLTNKSSLCLDETVIQDALPPNFKVIKTDPAADSSDGGYLTWKIARVNPHEVRTFVVTGTAQEAGTIKQCATLTCIPRACVEVAVVAPALQLTEVLPEVAMICDEINLRYTVTNSGTGPAKNVVVDNTLPEGLLTLDGKNTIRWDIGSLAAGETKQSSIKLRASKTGAFTNPAIASADANLKSEASAGVRVVQPVLTIAETGPESSFNDRPFCREIVVTNKGDAVAAKATLVTRLPQGVTVAENPDGGTAGDGTLTWNLGDIAPGGTKKVTFCLTPSAAGTFADTSTVRAVCAAAVTADARTIVKGIPAILIEVVDLDDPIRVGGQETYAITVTNQGSAPDTNIKIKCTLEDSMQFVSGTGDSGAANNDGASVEFPALGSLAPKAKANWRVVVKAGKAQDARFKVTMTSDELQRPVEETEATRFYD